jgi:hypothetical protein
MQITRTIAFFVSVGAATLNLGACGPGRTAAATQSTPAAFDATKSDAKALEIADKVIAAVGGEAAWAKAKQIDWTQAIVVDGQEKMKVTHYWDRWDGRHRFEKVDPVSGQDLMVAYEIFGETAWGTVRGKGDQPRDTIMKIKSEAVKRLSLDAFLLVFPFKLKDPGVTLKYVEERPKEGGTSADPMIYDVIKVTFDKGVGPTSGDAYYVVVNKSDSLIDHIEVVYEGKTDDQRVGYRFEDWQDIGGLKLSLKRQNIGFAAEVIQYSNVKVSAEPDDGKFVQEVR